MSANKKRKKKAPFQTRGLFSIISSLMAAAIADSATVVNVVVVIG